MPVPDVQSVIPPASLVLRGVDWFIDRRAAQRLNPSLTLGRPISAHFEVVSCPSR